MTLAALDAGKAVDCEKSLTHTIEEAQAVVKKQNETGRPLQVGVQSMSDACWGQKTNSSANADVSEYTRLENIQGTDFDQVTARQLTRVVNLINDRPRKRLKYQTPKEVFYHSPHVAFESGDVKLQLQQLGG